MNSLRIPPMNQLLADGEERGLDLLGRDALKAALQQALVPVRKQLADGTAPSELGAAFWKGVEQRLAIVPALDLRRAINATGVVLHTGLGRAPWPMPAVAAAAQAARSAVVEIERDSGARGRREHAVARRLCEITGAEAALPVNNNAAALLLAVSALSRGGKTVLSRGEMVEIGGSYRMPAVVRAAGAELVEIGTTNKTSLKDFEQALDDPDVRCVLRVHPSNFRQEGFIAMPPLVEITKLCRERAVPLVYDLGSGVLVGEGMAGLQHEPTVRQSLRDGADLVTFSGDKLLGGPQAGLIAGARPLVEALRRDMLTRCLRLDKTILAALEAVLAMHALGGEVAMQRVPALHMLSARSEELEVRVRAFAAALEERIAERAGVEDSAALNFEVTACEGRVGSGAAPEVPLPGFALALSSRKLAGAELARVLRMGEPPVFPRLHEEKVLLDLRTVGEDEEHALMDALLTAFFPE